MKRLCIYVYWTLLSAMGGVLEGRQKLIKVFKCIRCFDSYDRTSETHKSFGTTLGK